MRKTAQEKHASFTNPFRALYFRCVEKEKKSNLVGSPKELLHPQCRQSTTHTAQQSQAPALKGSAFICFSNKLLKVCRLRFLVSFQSKVSPSPADRWQPPWQTSRVCLEVLKKGAVHGVRMPGHFRHFLHGFLPIGESAHT